MSLVQYQPAGGGSAGGGTLQSLVYPGDSQRQQLLQQSFLQSSRWGKWRKQYFAYFDEYLRPIGSFRLAVMTAGCKRVNAFACFRLQLRIFLNSQGGWVGPDRTRSG